MLDIAIQLAAKLGGEYQDVTDLAKLPEDKLPEYQRYLNIKMVATG